eukprot:gene281-906_t
MAGLRKNWLQVEESWGIGNFRQTSGFPYIQIGGCDKWKYVCSLGPSIAIWDIKTKKRDILMQMTDDLIVCLLKRNSKHEILVISYSGQAKILDSDFHCICEFQVPSKNVVYACWNENGDRLCVCTIGQKSSVALFEFSSKGDEVKVVWERKASCVKHGTGEDEKFSNALTKEDSRIKVQDRHDDCYYGCLFVDDNTIFAVFKQHMKSCEGHLYNKDGLLLKQKTLSPLGDEGASMMCLSRCRNDVIVIGLQRGIFMFINCRSLDMLSVFQARGSPQVCLWDGNDLLTASYQSGTLQWWNVAGEVVKELLVASIDSIIHLNWSVEGKELWIAGITSLNYVSLEEICTEMSPESRVVHQKANTEHSLILHHLAGCGLSFKDDSILATGDLSGRVMVWDKMSESKRLCQPKYNFHLAESIRSLCWCNNYLLIGTLGGHLFKWTPEDSEPIEPIFVFESGVLTIRRSSKHCDVVAIGTGSGVVYIYDFSSNVAKMIMETQAHKPAIVSNGISHPMEVWSVSWNSSDTLIATASEDQTSVIISSGDGAKVATLTGHTTAVTSIDWKNTAIGCIIVTCADDRTIRINNGNDYTLIRVIQTRDMIYGWYTLTYLCINTFRNWILCSSQNGFIIIWDLVTSDFLVCERLHCGSIEGLALNSSMTSFATIGSDCVANIFKLEHRDAGEF